jgi:hypothetical protein
MIKILHVVAIASLIGSAGYAYSIKYDTIFHAEELARINAAAARERDAIAVLRAEWALLNRPDRVQALADAHLPDIMPMSAARLAQFSDLPARPERDDEIGRKLEALGLAAPTATPGAAGRAAATPSTRTPTR